MWPLGRALTGAGRCSLTPSSSLRHRLRLSVSHQTLILILSFVAFVSLGFPDAVLGVAWPSLRGAFDLPQARLGLVLSAAAAGYMTSGILAGKLINRMGVGQLLVMSTAFVTAGLFGYALSPSISIFLAFAVLVGFGSGAIDTALNYFATEHFSEAMMNRLHGFFGLGALIGPIIMGNLLDQGVTWRWGYVVIASIMLAMTTIFVVTRGLWDEGPHTQATSEPVATAPVRAVLASPVVWMQIVLFACIAGIEMTSGQWAFTVMRERMGQSDAVASLWSGFFWGAIAVGRLTLGAVSEKIGAARMVQGSIVGAVLGGVLYATGSYPVA
jgi:fucose permease